MTYSIVARCNKTGDLGVAIQSHWFNVGRETIWGHPGVGVIVTQSFIEPRYGEVGLKYLQSVSAQETLQRLLEEDNAAETRQVAMLGKSGLPAVHTGMGCISYAGHSFDENTSCQANLMQNEGVPEAMLQAYQNSVGMLADKMLAALYGAQAMGGDLRGQQSAAMLIVSGKASESWAAGVKINLRIENSQTPLADIADLLVVREAYDLLNASNAAWEEGYKEEATALYILMRRLQPNNQELIFWAKAAPEQDKKRLNASWNELSARMEGANNQV